MAAFLVDHGTLFVHHVIVFQQALTDAEVVLFHLLLCTLDALRDHGVLNHLTLLESQFVHDRCDALAGEESHQFVFQRDVEYAGARIALTACTSAQLAVYAPALVTFGADDGQSAGGLHLGRQFDVGTTAGHVGGDGHGTHSVLVLLSGQGHDVGLLLVQFGVQHLVGYAFVLAGLRVYIHVEHSRQQFGDFHRCGTDQCGAARLAHLHHLFDDGAVLVAGCLIDAVVHIDAGDGFVGGYLHHVEFIDVPELAGLGDGRTCHACQFVVHAEIVLQGDGGKGLCGGFHLHVLLGLHGLVQSVAPAASLHDTSCLLVHNFHLTVDDHVFVVLVEHGVCLEQLLQGVHAFALYGVVVHQFVLLVQALLVGQSLFGFQGRQLGGDVGQHEQFRVVHLLGQPGGALVRQVARVQFLIDHEVERLRDLMHPAVVVLHIDLFRLEHTGLDAFL